MISELLRKIFSNFFKLRLQLQKDYKFLIPTVSFSNKESHVNSIKNIINTSSWNFLFNWYSPNERAGTIPSGNYGKTKNEWSLSSSYAERGEKSNFQFSKLYQTSSNVTFINRDYQRCNLTDKETTTWVKLISIAFEHLMFTVSWKIF